MTKGLRRQRVSAEALQGQLQRQKVWVETELAQLGGRCFPKPMSSGNGSLHPTGETKEGQVPGSGPRVLTYLPQSSCCTRLTAGVPKELRPPRCHNLSFPVLPRRPWDRVPSRGRSMHRAAAP